ncbi:hypothetical protein YC2023_045634 [Brassica napus]|nr:unnamed protein product [Brassica napus]CAF2111278.1 unnamed protein product [Brassica napus]
MIVLNNLQDITEEKKSYPCPTEWLFGIPLRRRGIEFFWFDGKLGQKSEEKVLKDSMKPSQNSSASVSETWSRIESNRIFTRLLNGTISLQPYVKIQLDYGEMMAALYMAVVPIACTMPRILTNPSGLERRSNPLRVVRFQLKNNKMPEPKVPVRFDLDDHEQEPKEKSVEEREGLKTVEWEVEVVRFKSS